MKEIDPTIPVVIGTFPCPKMTLQVDVIDVLSLASKIDDHSRRMGSLPNRSQMSDILNTLGIEFEMNPVRHEVPLEETP